jgi:thymidylate kinase
VSFSGLDGSGKSSQAAALRDTLDRLGYDAVVHWSSVSQHGALLHFLVDTARWALRRGRRGGGGVSQDDDPAKAFRQGNPVAGIGWTLLVALMNAYRHARGVNRHLWLGRVVICDRYVLDSKVHLRYAYGEERSYAVHLALIRLLSPRPDISFFLDVSAETATARKPDYELRENMRLAHLYREESVAFATRRIDAGRPRGEICAEVADAVWGALA